MRTTLTLIITFSFLMAGTPSQAQTTKREDRQKLQTAIKLISQIEKKTVYIMENPEDSDQENQYRQFARLISPFESLKLAMENKNPIVRIYAFRAASDRMDNLPEELILKFKQDTTPVKVKTLGEEKEVPLHEIANGFLK